MATISYEGTVDELHDEDQGRARVATITDGDKPEGMFFRLQSWSDTPKQHAEFDALGLKDGMKVRITVEVLP